MMFIKLGKLHRFLILIIDNLIRRADNSKTINTMNCKSVHRKSCRMVFIIYQNNYCVILTITCNQTENNMS